MRTWKKYINRQKYSECQLVTAINAYYYLTGKTIKQDSQEYEDLVDLSGARYGSAISIEKVHKKLGLKIIGYSILIGYDEWYKLGALKKRETKKLPKKIKLPKKRGEKIRLPIEINVWHKKTGFHSVLIVDHCLKTQCFRITNFRCVTSLDGWMFAEDLYQFTNDAIHGWVFRLFGLNKNIQKK